jgi:hypothetical protein
MGLLSWLMKEKPRVPSVLPVPPVPPVKVALAPPRTLTHNTVKPDNTPLHLKRGWTRRGNFYQGFYRTKYGAWQGVIGRRGDKFKVYIFSPPTEQISKHPRWPCFHEEAGGRWRIDLAVNPHDGDVGAIIFYVEKVIVDSFRL